MIHELEPSTLPDTLPPHSIDAEKALLASLLIDNHAIDMVQERMADGDAFYLIDHRYIYRAIIELYNAGRRVDAVILRAELQSREQLDMIGGAAYLAELLHLLPSAANVERYTEIVVDCFGWRELIATANDALRTAWNCGGGISYEEAASSFAARAECIRDTGGADPTVTLYEAMRKSVDALRNGKPKRLLTGLNDGDPNYATGGSEVSFDCIAGGFPFRGTTIIGGRPGSGKSAFVKSILLRLAKIGWRVGIVTIEEDRIKIGDNALAHESDVQNWKIQQSIVNDDEHDTLRQVAEEYKGLPFWIDDTCLTLVQVEAALRRLKRKYRCHILVVDHLHLIEHDTGRKNESRNDNITAISRRLKSLFRRLDVIGIEVCQLNRQGEGIDNMPGLTTLREGGALEQDGDLICFLHRRDYYRNIPGMSDGQPLDHKMEIHVAKNKGGSTGIALAYWDGDRQSVGDWHEGREP